MAKPSDFVEASFLGTNPICDICGKSIKSGDVIKQVIHGPAVFMDDENELAVTGHYEVFHVACNPLQELK